MIDIQASVESLLVGDHVHDGMLKHIADLARYQRIIEATRPDVVVETGTYSGASARWFAGRGCDVITVDINQQGGNATVTHAGRRVDAVWGDAADPGISAYVAELVAGRRCMVSLDSYHSAAHVAREIELYGPLVTEGCYLVVEDTIFAYAPAEAREAQLTARCIGTPLDAVRQLLVNADGWELDVDLEDANPISHHPWGWWRRVPALAALVSETTLIEPGDHLVLRVDPRTPRASVDGLRKQIDALRQANPWLGEVLVFAVEQLAVYRPAPPIDTRTFEDGGQILQGWTGGQFGG